jgi:hypothetical protein
MIGWLARFVVYRVFGREILAAFAILRFIHRRFLSRRPTKAVYQPSQGASQTTQREPR